VTPASLLCPWCFANCWHIWLQATQTINLSQDKLLKLLVYKGTTGRLTGKITALATTPIGWHGVHISAIHRALLIRIIALNISGEVPWLRVGSSYYFSVGPLTP
jgi:hypothetical protein